MFVSKCRIHTPMLYHAMNLVITTHTNSTHIIVHFKDAMCYVSRVSGQIFLAIIDINFLTLLENIKYLT